MTTEKTHCIFSHKWGRYGEPEAYVSSQRPEPVSVQKRTCARCNAIEYRFIEVRKD